MQIMFTFTEGDTEEQDKFLHHLNGRFKELWQYDDNKLKPFGFAIATGYEGYEPGNQPREEQKVIHERLEEIRERPVTHALLPSLPFLNMAPSIWI